MRHAPKGPVKVHPGEPIEPPDPMERRCTATNRQGHRCGKWAILGGNVCRNHGGAAPQVMLKAKERLAAMVPKAMRVLDALLGRAEFPTVQFQTARFIAEQEVGKAQESVSMELGGDAALMQALMAGRKRAAESRKG